MNKAPKINGKRLLADLHQFSTYTETPGDGVTRFSYGAMDRKARAALKAMADRWGLSFRTDEVGNIRMGLSGNRPGRKTILAGSHIDTVQNGGWLDGIYGSLAALEVLRTLAERETSHADEPGRNKLHADEPGRNNSDGGDLERNFEVVIFAEEEGSNFNSTLTGSKFATGHYGPEDLNRLKNHAGVTLAEMLGDLAGATDATDEPALPLPWDFTDMEAMVEMHIEQGPVLEREGLQLGIVDSIFGMRLVEFEIDGVGNHAGASPMAGRRDALTAASACILLAERIAARDPGHETVATAGKLFVSPNSTNVIPEKVTFTVEVRDRDNNKIQDTMEEIIAAFKSECHKRDVGLKTREVADNKAIHLKDDMVKFMTTLADRSGLDFQVMGSGAVHDASMLAQKVDVAMIFVPSIGGRSHVREENTKETDLVAGGAFLMDVIWAMLQKR